MHRASLYTAQLLLYLSLLLPAGCGKKAPELPLLNEEAVLLAFGDSLTYGTGVAPEQSYPTVLEKLIGRTVINAGIPGEISKQGVERLPETLDEYQPNLLLLCHGGNDFLQKLDEKQTIDNIRAMINSAESRNIKVVLIGVPKPGMFLKAADFYRKIAKTLKIPYESRTIAETLSKQELKSDMIHPNAAGYAQIAEDIARLLRDSGALTQE